MTTKKPKSINVEWNTVQYTTVTSKYRCPNCKVVYEGYLKSNTSRFYCTCGQELIIKNPY